MRSAGAEQPFSKKTCIQQARNNCFRKKQTFQGVGTTIFEKNTRSKGLEQLFSEKINVQQVRNNRFQKNARSKGLDDGLSQKRRLFGTEIGH